MTPACDHVSTYTRRVGIQASVCIRCGATVASSRAPDYPRVVDLAWDVYQIRAEATLGGDRWGAQAGAGTLQTQCAYCVDVEDCEDPEDREDPEDAAGPPVPAPEPGPPVTLDVPPGIVLSVQTEHRRVAIHAAANTVVEVGPGDMQVDYTLPPHGAVALLLGCPGGLTVSLERPKPLLFWRAFSASCVYMALTTESGNRPPGATPVAWEDVPPGVGRLFARAVEGSTHFVPIAGRRWYCYQATA